ncbi:hypothetical protein CSUI_006697, partial [Cystoisospora suis]
SSLASSSSGVVNHGVHTADEKDRSHKIEQRTEEDLDPLSDENDYLVVKSLLFTAPSAENLAPGKGEFCIIVRERNTRRSVSVVVLVDNRHPVSATVSAFMPTNPLTSIMSRGITGISIFTP